MIVINKLRAKGVLATCDFHLEVIEFFWQNFIRKRLLKRNGLRLRTEALQKFAAKEIELTPNPIHEGLLRKLAIQKLNSKTLRESGGIYRLQAIFDFSRSSVVWSAMLIGLKPNFAINRLNGKSVTAAEERKRPKLIE